MDMDLIVKWSSILSPLIAVIIAVWSGISSRKATAKQLAAIEESTAKQVKSIRQLTYIQLKLAKIQLDKELAVARRQKELIDKEIDNANEVNTSILGSYLNDFTQKEAKRRLEQKNLHSKGENCFKTIEMLKGSLKNLTELKKEVDSHE